jgi:hypothetical protein
MKENLTKAYHSAQFLAREIREAHADAVNSGNHDAEIALFDMIESTMKLEEKLKRLVDASETMKRVVAHRRSLRGAINI